MALLAGLALIGLVSTAGWLIGVLSGASTAVPHAAIWAAVALLIFALFTSLGFVARSFRRAAGPLADVMVAAGRVEAGDYAVRVPEPRQAPGELRRLVHAINTMIARLEVDEEQRRALLADVSHELRTPLTVIRGRIEAMLDGVHAADEEHLAGILDEVQVLSRLVDDLRTLVLSEAGTLALHREPIDLSALIAEVADGFRPAAQRAGINLVVETLVRQDRGSVRVEVDPVRMREIFSNLIDNALRYTPREGSVRVTERKTDEALITAVSDSGPGIDPEMLARIFERFVKGADSHGSGLGLAIARNLTEAHGGSISAESALGLGTTITVRLPAN